MKLLAGYIMRGRFQAAAVTSLFGLLTWLLLPASYISGAAIGLSVLRHGSLEGGKVMALATLMVTAIALLSFGSLVPVYALIVLWIPTWFGAAVLRATASQGMLLSALGLLAAALVVWLYLSTGINEERWLKTLQDLYRMVPGAQTNDAVQAQLRWFAGLMNGLIAALMLCSLVATIYIARWWQASLYNPGGFRKEFRELRIPQAFLVIAGALVMLGFMYNPEGESLGLGAHFALVMAAVYMFQGLAVVHFKFGVWQLGVGWLVVLYVFLVIRWHYVVPFLGILGAADSLVDLRGLRRKRLNSDDDG